MRIEFVEIQNFRKLKSCRIDFSPKETIFVGANNSGKTSAMDALIIFLESSNHKKLSTTDFTITNWRMINQLVSPWVSEKTEDSELNPRVWHDCMPSIDVWIDVEEKEIHYVSHIIPTLDWCGGRLGVRLIFEPRNVEQLYKDYTAAFNTARETESLGNKQDLKIWPKSIHEFLSKNFHEYFSIKSYALDPSKYNEECPQTLLENSVSLGSDPFSGLFKIDIINAQRGFSDVNANEKSGNADRKLSSQLRKYFDNHLNPSELPDAGDLEALESIQEAKKVFDSKLKASFSESLKQLEKMNYPGFDNPKISLSSRFNPIEGLNHESAVQFNLWDQALDSDEVPFYLPEKYNGLGYQNLISMMFNLIRFRDEWMRVGKVGKKALVVEKFIEPLHLVMVEEPEAHLHPQIQQVFIKKAYEILRTHKELENLTQFSTQLLVSTHSSHIAYEADFCSLRYFKKIPPKSSVDINCSEAVNLSSVFGEGDLTSKFVTRYLRTTHCDLFFADVAILVEGPVEKMLIPHFIRNHYPKLDSSYICLLEIGGSHAHRLKPLIEKLGLFTLIITDLDSLRKGEREKVRPERNKGYITGNDTIKTWIPQKEDLDKILDLDEKEKVKDNIKVTYQKELEVDHNGQLVNVIPYTFEDALVLSNIKYFKAQADSTGLMQKMYKAIGKGSIQESCEDMFESLKNGKKAEMALQLLYMTEPSEIIVPAYIVEGLKWIEHDCLNQYQ